MARFAAILTLLAVLSQVEESVMAEKTSVEWVCIEYTERIEALFNNLDLDREGLEEVKAAVQRGELVQACEALLEYYHTGDSGSWLRRPAVAPGEGRDEAADAILDDMFTFYLQTDRLPRREDGGLLWTHPGPSGDWEWTLALNRHHHIRQLLRAYFSTGNSDYARRIDEDIRDWIIASLPYPAEKNVGSIWRGLEISFRSKVWAEVFYALQESEYLTPATRLLMLTSLPEHAHHARNFHGRNNWLTMELSGLAMIAAAWQEFKKAPEWFDYASKSLTRELAGQVYPDGAQHELSSHYHLVALSNFNQFAEICRGAGLPLSDEFSSTLESMWHYLACTMRPDGHGLLNNDSDLDYNRDRLLAAAKTYDRADWSYIASNGAQGTDPDYGPSIMLPWAGQLVIRSGWDIDALWAFFDLGPWGTGHQHNDKLHLSVSAYGRDLLVDSGRFTYSGKDVRFRRQYAVLSRAHNVIIIDGKGQAPGPRVAQKPIPEHDYSVAPEITFARGSCDYFDKLEGKAVHTRVVFYLQDGIIIVADRIETDRPRTLETLWHWHPRCTVETDGGTIVSTDDGAGNLRIVPISGFNWNIELVRGQEEPHLQGWYSRRYNEWEPSTAAVLKAEISESTSFAWILLTARGAVGNISGSITEDTKDALGMEIHLPGGEKRLISIPWKAALQ